MWIDLLAIVLAAALCGLWVVVQHFVSDHDPCQPGVEGQCGCKGAAEASCRRRPPSRSPEEAA